MHIRVIKDGKLYDTDTAERIAACWNGGGPCGLRDPNEALYKTRNGNFFLAAERYHPYRHTFVPVVIPLTMEGARKWCEHHCDVETTRKYFTIEEA